MVTWGSNTTTVFGAGNSASSGFAFGSAGVGGVGGGAPSTPPLASTPATTNLPPFLGAGGGGRNSKRTADNGATAEMGNKKFKWPCKNGKTTGCPKQAQTRCQGLCKNCYHEFSLNLPRSDSTQGAENRASLGNHGSRASNPSMAYVASLEKRINDLCASTPSMTYVISLEKRINDLENLARQLKRKMRNPAIKK